MDHFLRYAHLSSILPGSKSKTLNILYLSHTNNPTGGDQGEVGGEKSSRSKILREKLASRCCIPNMYAPDPMDSLHQPTMFQFFLAIAHKSTFQLGIEDEPNLVIASECASILPSLD